MSETNPRTEGQFGFGSSGGPRKARMLSILDADWYERFFTTRLLASSEKSFSNLADLRVHVCAKICGVPCAIEFARMWLVTFVTWDMCHWADVSLSNRNDDTLL
jgi:hypothetical protein